MPPNGTTGALLDSVLTKLDTAKRRAESVISAAEKRGVDLNAAESAEVDELLAHVTSLAAHRDQLIATERRARAAAPLAQTGIDMSTPFSGRGPATIGYQPSVYQRSNPETSYFRDLYEARTTGNRDAADRLVRNDRENRALSNTGQTSTIGAGGGAGGEFAPPAWLIDDFVKLARPGRVFADRASHDVLPNGVANVNLPRVATGTSTAVQSTQNSALSQTDLASNSVSSSITTVGGKQVVSMQLLQQSGLNFDQVILSDLAGDYAKSLDLQFISGTGSAGQLRGVTGIAGATVTYTDASPAVAGAGKFYAQVAKAVQTIETARYAPPDAIVMHPRRFAWMLASFDSSNRPLFVPGSMAPQQQGVNTLGSQDAVLAQGAVGSMMGLPIYTDANIATNLGTGTNQDTVYVGRFADCWLYESPVQAEAFTATYADTMGVLFRLFAYSASIPDRYPASVCLISGTGLVTPSF